MPFSGPCSHPDLLSFYTIEGSVARQRRIRQRKASGRPITHNSHYIASSGTPGACVEWRRD